MNLNLVNVNASVGEQEPPKKKKKPDLPIVQIKNAADYQRMKLERLMANPDKPIIIPGPGRNKNPAPPPDFVRNIMGSSAGAGSGEFHVYRHLRRKEYARQKHIVEQAKLEQKETDFRDKMELNKRSAEEKTAKKRAKRLKKKAGKRKSNNAGVKLPEKSSSSSSSSDSEGQAKEEKSQEVSKSDHKTTEIQKSNDKILEAPPKPNDKTPRPEETLKPD